jgi:hypothetical protein
MTLSPTSSGKRDDGPAVLRPRQKAKRGRGVALKINAFRFLLARECELNHWAHKRLRDALADIQKHFAKKEPYEYAIERRTSGEIVFKQRRSDSQSESWPLPPIHTDLMSQLMLDMATLDKSLFGHLEAAYDSANNMKHVRQSLIDFIESDDQRRKLFFEAFPEYGLRELKDALIDLNKLYSACTGETLKSVRVR